MKALIVEDEPSLEFLFKEFLKMKGIETEEAENGYKALIMLHKNKYDFLILDIKIEGKNGIEILEEMRKKGDKTPVIVCTAFKHLKDDIFFVSDENVFFFSKPINIEELTDVINKNIMIR